MKSEAIHQRRRSYICRMLDIKGAVYYSDIKDVFPGATRQQIGGDLELLRGIGYRVDIEKDGRDRCIFLPSSSGDSQYRRRMRHNDVEKKKVAHAVVALVTTRVSTSLPEWLENQIESEHQRILKIYGPLFKEELSIRFQSIRKKLLNFVSKRTKRLFIDAGTTNFATAIELSKIPFPNVSSGINEFDVWTNSRHISCLLGHHSCEVRTGWVGGVQRMETEAISDGIAVRFIDELMPPIDLAVIGTVGITKDSFKSDNKDDASLKAHALGKSALKIVTSSHFKFKNDLGFRSFTPQDLFSGSVDLILVDQMPVTDFEIKVPVIVSPSL